MTDTSGFSADNPTEIVITGKKKAPPPPAPPKLIRRPRGVVKINGQSISNFKFDVDNATHFNSDKWRVDIQCWNQPEGFGIDFWESAQAVQVECLMGFLEDGDDVSNDPSDPTSLIIGQVDNVAVNAVNGTIALSGRDLTAKLIDTKTTNKWPDAVASFIVTQLANQVGLTPDVTDTDTPVGQYYNNAYASLTRDIPMWDLITFLAQQEGFDTYVSGTKLYFGPPQADDDQNPVQVVVSPPDDSGFMEANVTELGFGRSLTLAGDISVTVLSHGVKNGTIKATATRAGTKASSSSAAKNSANVQNYTIRRPNLTQEQAQVLANNTLSDLSKHERTLSFCIEGDPAITVRRMISVSGTDTGFDQKYYFQEIHQSYAFGGKYEMEIRGKNHPTTSEPAI